MENLMIPNNLDAMESGFHITAPIVNVEDLESTLTEDEKKQMWIAEV